MAVNGALHGRPAARQRGWLSRASAGYQAPNRTEFLIIFRHDCACKINMLFCPHLFSNNTNMLSKWEIFSTCRFNNYRICLPTRKSRIMHIDYSCQPKSPPCYSPPWKQMQWKIRQWEAYIMLNWAILLTQYWSKCSIKSNMFGELIAILAISLTSFFRCTERATPDNAVFHGRLTARRRGWVSRANTCSRRMISKKICMISHILVMINTEHAALLLNLFQ